MLAEVRKVWLTVLRFWGKFENLILIFTTHWLVDFVYSNLEHLDLIDDVKNLIFFLRRLCLLHFCKNLFTNTTSRTNNRANPCCCPEVWLTSSHRWKCWGTGGEVTLTDMIPSEGPISIETICLFETPIVFHRSPSLWMIWSKRFVWSCNLTRGSYSHSLVMELWKSVSISRHGIICSSMMGLTECLSLHVCLVLSHLVLDLSSLCQDCIFTCAKESSYFTFRRIWNELLQ